MSWFSQNYEKAAVGGAAIAALSLALLGWSKVGDVLRDFNANTQGSGPTEPSVPNADLVTKAVSSLALNHAWTQAETEGRPVDLKLARATITLETVEQNEAFLRLHSLQRLFDAALGDGSQ